VASVERSAGRPSRGSGIIDALNQEWCRIDSEQGVAVADWARRHAVLSTCTSANQVLNVVRSSDSDAALRVLLAATAAGEQLAGRVVLQSMLGRMVQMAHRDARAGVDDYVAALWCQIGTYPLARRPARIAANLALDTLKAVHREHRWLVRGEVTTWPPGVLLDELFNVVRGQVAPDGHHSDPDARAVLAAARSLKLIDDAATSILTSVYLDGLSGAEAARRHGTSAGSIRVRCSRAVGRLSRSAAALSEAA